jgi:hypothetical protein
MKLENPKTFPASMLFFGCLFVLLGKGIESITANSDLYAAGWFLIAVSVCLWIFEHEHKKKC